MGFRNQGVEKEIILLTITPSDSLGNFLPVFTTLNSAGLDVLATVNGVSASASPISVELEAQTSHSVFGFLISLS